MKKWVYSILTLFIWQNSYAQTFLMPHTGSDSSESCSGSLFDSGGPGGVYGNGATGIFQIISLNGGAISANVISLDIEGGFDKLQIFDGAMESGLLLAELTGTLSFPENNPPFVALSGMMTIRFISDITITLSGFQIDWIIEGGSDPLLPAFSISNSAPPLGTPVSFTNLTLADADYLWDFGDGSISSEIHPVHIYTSPGSYSITLTGINCESSYYSPLQTITVQTPPEISVIPAAIEFAINTDETAFEPISIANTGTGDLSYTISLDEVSPPSPLKILYYDNREGLDANSVLLADASYAILEYLLDNELARPHQTSRTETTDSHWLEVLLRGKSVFILPYRPFYDLATITSFAPVLSDFTEKGGQVLVMGNPANISDPTHNVLNATGLFSAEYSGAAENILAEGWSHNHVMLQNVVADSIAGLFAYPYVFNGSLSIISLAGDEGTILASHNAGSGRVYYFGFPLSYDVPALYPLLHNLFMEIDRNSFLTSLNTSTEGILTPGSILSDTISVYGYGWQVGINSAVLTIQSNDSDEPFSPVSVLVEVNPLAIVEYFPAELEFGHIPAGQSVSRHTEIINSGNSIIQITGIQSTHPAFDAPDLLLQLLPYSSIILPVSFAASGAGILSGEIQIITNAGNITIPVTGSATGAPAPSIYPTTIDLTIDGGTVEHYPIQISNSGGGDCFYEMSNEAFISNSGIAITFSATGNFPIPFYLLQLKDLTSSETVASFTSPFFSGINANQESITGLDPAHQYQFQISDPQINCLITSLQVTDLTTGDLIFSNEIPCGINYFSPVLSPAINPADNWLSLQPLAGVVTALNSATADLVIDASQLTEGNYENTLVLTHNAPSVPPLSLPVSIHVIGHPLISLSAESIAFGEIMAGTQTSETITIENPGSGYLTISDMIFDVPYFSVNGGIFSIPPHQAQTYTLLYHPQESGSHSGQLQIVSDADTLFVSLIGNASPAPIAASIPGEIEITLQPDEMLNFDLELWNLGGGDMTYTYELANTDTICGYILTYIAGPSAGANTYSWSLFNQTNNATIISGPSPTEMPNDTVVHIIDQIDCGDSFFLLQVFPFVNFTTPIWTSFQITDINTGAILMNAGVGTIGQTFTLLPSSSVPLYSWVTLEGSGGNVVSYSYNNIHLEFNSTDLVPGTYENTLVIHTNDPQNPTLEIPITLTVTGQIEAAISADETSVCEEWPLQFYDESTNSPTEWHWDFGDGSFSEEQNPTHIYEENGMYEVSLEACNSLGCDISASITIQANMGCSMASIPADEHLIIDNCSGYLYDSGGPYESYLAGNDGSITIYIAGTAGILLSFLSFDYEEAFDHLTVFAGPDTQSPVFGIYGAGNVPASLYIPGEYVTILEHTDANTEMEGFELFFACSEFVATPEAWFEWNESSLCTGNISFTDASLYLPDSWHWNFGDGTTSNQRNPEHLYETPGLYTVSLEACNASGCHSTSRDIIVHSELWTPEWPHQVSLFEEVIFNAYHTDISSWTWDFGDDTAEMTGPEVSHIYAEPGNYIIHLTLTDAQNQDCIQTFLLPISVELGSGIGDPDTGFLLYPNPATDRLYVQIPEGGNKTSHLSIRDIAGRLVFDEFIGHRNQAELRLSGLMAGVYLVTLADEQRTITQRLLIQ